MPRFRISLARLVCYDRTESHAVSEQNRSMRRLTGPVLAVASLILPLLLGACGDDPSGVLVGWSGENNHEDPTTLSVAEGDIYIATVTVEAGGECTMVGNDCIVIDGETGSFCGMERARADIAVVEGEVLAVICFPPDDDGTPIEEVAVEEGAQIPQPENGVVIIFDESTNGEVVEGDIVINAERTTILGNGIDQTIIGGNVTVLSNNSRIREVTIQGDLRYGENSNNSAISFSNVRGNLQIGSNGFSAFDIQVFGDVQVIGKNTQLFKVGIQGDPLWEGVFRSSAGAGNG